MGIRIEPTQLREPTDKLDEGCVHKALLTWPLWMGGKIPAPFHGKLKWENEKKELVESVRVSGKSSQAKYTTQQYMCEWARSVGA